MQTNNALPSRSTENLEQRLVQGDVQFRVYNIETMPACSKSCATELRSCLQACDLLMTVLQMR